MPSRVYVTFNTSGSIAPLPSQLHAAWGHVFDLPEGVSLEQAQLNEALSIRTPHRSGGVKSYSIGQMMHSGDQFGMELKFLDDALVSIFHAWLNWGGILRLTRPDNAPDALLVPTSAEVIEYAAWDDIANDSGNTQWRLDFLSPTTFRSQNTYLPEPTPARIAKSLQDRWHHWNPELAPPPFTHDETDDLSIIENDTYAVKARMNGPHSRQRNRNTQGIEAFEGTLTVAARPESAVAQDFSRLMSLARFTNIGSYGTSGMGVVAVTPMPPIDEAPAQ